MVSKTATKGRAKPPRTQIDEDTDKRARFVEEYLIDFNATQAAKRAGYSPKTAYAQGSRLLKDAEVQKRLAAGRAEIRENVGITRDRILGELAKIGFSDIRKAVRWQTSAMTEDEVDEQLEGQAHGGALKRARRVVSADVVLIDSTEIDDDTAAAISEISQGPNGLKVKFHSKREALVDLGRAIGVFKDPGEIVVPVRFVIEGAPTKSAPSKEAKG